MYYFNINKSFGLCDSFLGEGKIEVSRRALPPNGPLPPHHSQPPPSPRGNNIAIHTVRVVLNGSLTEIEFDKSDGQILIKWEIDGIPDGRYFHKDLVLRAIFEYTNKHGKVLNPVL